MATEPQRRRRTLVGSVALLATVAGVLFGLFWIADFFFVRGRLSLTGPFWQFLDFDPDTLQNALGNLAQVIAAVLGIAITVVSIVVQLASTRYTPRVADIFFRDRKNIAVMGFFVVSCIDAIWVSVSVGDGYVPSATILVTLMLVSLSLLVLIPYFAYVFDFLDPAKVIARIGEQTLAAALGKEGPHSREVLGRQAVTVVSMENLGDIAVNALGQKDKVIAAAALGAIEKVVIQYIPRKTLLERTWFEIRPSLRENPDLVSLAPDSIRELAEGRCWLEWKALRQINGVYSEALKALPEMAHVGAIETRYIGEAALNAGDRAVVNLVIKFFNTYLRGALNARDVRTAYNVFNQYRLLTEYVMLARERKDSSELTVEMAGYFKYYAQLAHAMKLPFITETAAYDLCALCEIAFNAKAECHDRLLAILLQIDKQAENLAEEKALRGVRKAQVKLATHYLVNGAEPLARLIFEDMANESRDRMQSIQNELMAITTKQFWEVIDRGTNFDYLDEKRKQRLREFFTWFPDMPEPTTPRPDAVPVPTMTELSGEQLSPGDMSGLVAAPSPEPSASPLQAPPTPPPPAGGEKN